MRVYLEKADSHYFKLGDKMISVSSRLVKFDEDGDPYIEFPLRNASIQGGVQDRYLKLKTGKGNVFLVTTYITDCDFRYTKIEINTEAKAKIYKFQAGWSAFETFAGALIVSKSDEIKVKWSTACNNVKKDWIEIHTIDGNVVSLPCHTSV